VIVSSIVAVLDQENPVELGLPAGFDVQLLDGQNVPFLDTILFSA
jgi:hypothetical protein